MLRSDSCCQLKSIWLLVHSTRREHDVTVWLLLPAQVNLATCTLHSLWARCYGLTLAASSSQSGYMYTPLVVSTMLRSDSCCQLKSIWLLVHSTRREHDVTVWLLLPAQVNLATCTLHSSWARCYGLTLAASSSQSDYMYTPLVVSTMLRSDSCCQLKSIWLLVHFTRCEHDVTVWLLLPAQVNLATCTLHSSWARCYGLTLAASSSQSGYLYTPLVVSTMLRSDSCCQLKSIWLLVHSTRCEHDVTVWLLLPAQVNLATCTLHSSWARCYGLTLAASSSQSGYMYTPLVVSTMLRSDSCCQLKSIWLLVHSTRQHDVMFWTKFMMTSWYWHTGLCAENPREAKLWWFLCCQPALQWRHNGRDGVSNHQPRHYLLNRLFRHRSKKTSKLRVTGLCAGNSLVTDEFSAQMASNADNFFIQWRQHG